MAQALGERSEVQHHGREQRVAERLHVDGGIVKIAADLGKLQLCQSTLIVNNGRIGGVFGAETGRLELRQAGVEILVEPQMAIERSGTEIVEQIVEVLALVFVQSHA